MLIFDEVQLCERVCASLKSLRENAPKYHVIAAGSLAGRGCQPGEVFFSCGKSGYQDDAPYGYGRVLNAYMETYASEYSIKLSAQNFGFEAQKRTVPLYAAFCI